MFRETLAEEMAALRTEIGEAEFLARKFKEAGALLDRLPGFLTLEAYGLL